ncbi:hypothetical protein GCM10027048_06770 [Hymenobacter coalescens]
MSTIKKVIEVLASSDKSFEDALQRALTEASTTLKGIKSIYVKEQSCAVEDNKIVEYRVTAKITFEVMHRWQPGHATASAEEVDGGGVPDYSGVDLNAAPQLPRPVEPGGSATAPESGGGYSG